MVNPRWLEVSLTVDSELAEAISEILSRFSPNGVVNESGVVYNDVEDEGTPLGPIRVYAYLLFDDTLETKRQKIEEALWHLGQIQQIPQPEYRVIEDEDWMSSWKKHYHPILIGRRLLILPAWMEQEDKKRLIIRIDPSMAFGTGTHPSTQLCLELLEYYTQRDKPIIDVGCGSGILSIAALKLGASHALGVDVDAASLRSSRENAAANEVEAQLEVGLGSVKEILRGQYSIRNAPVVVVNILAPVIQRLFDTGLSDLVEEGGTLILAGILQEQAKDILQTAEKYHLEPLDQRFSADWVALAFQAFENGSHS